MGTPEVPEATVYDPSLPPRSFFDIATFVSISFAEAMMKGLVLTGIYVGRVEAKMIEEFRESQPTFFDQKSIWSVYPDGSNWKIQGVPVFRVLYAERHLSAGTRFSR